MAGEEPKLTLDELAQVHGLVFAPWISGGRKDDKIVRNFRADSVDAGRAPGKTGTHAA